MVNVADANRLIINVAKFVLRRKKTTKPFTIYCVSLVILRYLHLYLGQA